MPGIYEGVCRDCGHKTGWKTRGYGAVLVDRDQTGPRTLEERVLSIQSTGVPVIDNEFRLVILRHPGESDILDSLGYTWKDLREQGRYVGFTEFICRHCGVTFERRELASPEDAGCAPTLLSGLGIGLLSGIWSHNVFVGLIAFWLTSSGVSMALTYAHRLSARHRFSERAALLATNPTCPSCDSTDYTVVGGSGTFKCAVCSSKSLKFEMVAMS